MDWLWGQSETRLLEWDFAEFHLESSVRDVFVESMAPFATFGETPDPTVLFETVAEDSEVFPHGRFQ